MSVGGGGNNTPPPTAQEIALAETSKARFDFQQANFAPLENKLLERTSATKQSRELAKGIAGADAAQAFPKRAVGRNQASRQGLALAQASGSAKAGAEGAVVQRDLQGKLAFSALGHNVANTANLSLISATNRATSSAIQKAKLDVAKDELIAGSIATGLGAAAQANGLLNTKK